MIRVGPVISKPTNRPSQTKKGKAGDEENQRPASFNTRGYFDPTNCSDQQYLNEKQRVFQKYRSRHHQIVMLDIKNTNKPMLIQRGLPRPQVNQQEGCTQTTKNLLKSYLSRKERHISHQQEKYLQVPKLAIDTLAFSSNPASSRSSHRQVTSRISTATVLKIEGEF